LPAASLATASLALTLAGGSAGASTTSPRIVLKPSSQMVNQKVGVEGFGFPAHQTLKIEECAKTVWIVPQKAPCVPGNGVTVITDTHGVFKAAMTAKLCGGKRVFTSETCYVGWPQPRGVDTVQLIGAAKLVVTYP
jgi:hypothetical protein